MKAILLGTVAALSVFGSAAAQSRTWNIPAGDAAASLQAYARQSGKQVLFPYDAVHGRTAPAVRGHLSDAEVLAVLATSAGLVIASDDGRTVTLRPPTQAAGGAAAAEPAKLAEVMVTGSRLQGEQAGPRPVNVYTSEVIARSGQVRLDSFLNSLPEVSVSASGNAFMRFGGQTGVRLRGLPDGSTAVLVDGRRAGTSGLNVVSYFDINTIPVGLIERVDIVPIGSSAIYGSDAIGGVLNIVLKKRFEGVEATADYSFADQHQERGASLILGKTFDRGSLVLGATYHDQDGLLGFDRAITANSDFRRFAAQGGIDWRLPYCDPGNVDAASGNLNGLGASSAAIPAEGAETVANYRPGQQNTCSYFAATPMVTPSQRMSLYGSGEYDLGGGTTAYASFLASRVRNDTRQFGLPIVFALVPAANPFNPFHQDVFVTTSLPVNSGALLKTTLIRPVVGLRGDLPSGWDWDVSAWASLLHEDGDQTSSSLTTANLAPFLARTDRATGFNLFTPTANSPALISEVVVRNKIVSHSEQDVLLGVLRGTPMQLWAGPLRTAAGVEFRYDDYWTRDTDLTISKGGRRAAAVFAEAGVPLISPAADGGPARLEATLAARYDHYSDFGGQVSPQVGLQGRFGDGFSLAATASKSFKAPGLGWLHQSRITFPNGGTLADPRRGEAYPMNLIIGGNPNLEAETGKARSVTLAWTSERFEGVQVTATYFDIGMDNRTGALGFQTIINNEARFPDRIVREPSSGGFPGRIVSVDNSYTNFGSIRVRGIDVHASYSWRTDYGVFRPAVALTRMLEYKSQLKPDQPYVDRLSKATSTDAWSPRFKGTTSLNWSGDAAEAMIQGRYVGKYLDHQDFPNSNILGGDWYLDASLKIPLRSISRDVPSPVYLRISGTNLLDKLPRYSNYNSGLVGYDPYESDIIGRTLSIGLDAHF
jgi:iron complex outermembrane receptor protein